MNPALLLAVTLAAQGFGGEAPEECWVQLDDGRRLTCDEVLAQPRSAPAATPAAEPATAGQPEPERERAPLVLPDDGKPKIKVRSEEPDFEAQLQPALGPWGAALKSADQERKASILSTLRKEVTVLAKREAWYRGEVDQGRKRPAEHEVVRQELLARRSILADVEVIGLRMREECAASKGVTDQLPMERVPVGVRMLLTDPVVEGLLLVADPKDCQREELVTQTVVDRVLLLHQLDHRLRTEKFGYFKSRERIKLQRQRDALIDEVKGIRRLSTMRLMSGEMPDISESRLKEAPVLGQ